MMFNNAESVYIDGKEVESIITADGGVLYEKNPSYDLTLSCTKDILSLHDNDSCILTGVLTLNGFPVSDETVDYSIMHNDTILDEGALVSNINGEISLEYFAAGAGDVNVIFSLRSLLQKTYVIEDCDTYFTTSQITNFSRVKQDSSSFAISDYSISLSEYSFEFKATGAVQLGVGNQNDWGFACRNKNFLNEIYLHNSDGTTYTDDNIFSSLNEKYRVEITRNTVKVYKNDTLIKTYTDKKLTGYPTNITIYPYSNRGNVSYIKVKAL